LRGVLALLAQFEAGLHPGRVNLLQPLFTLVIAACGVALLLGALSWAAPRVRRALRARIASRRRLRAAASAELRARAMMDELCPHGWSAKLALLGGRQEPPSDSPDSHRDLVALDWAEFDGEGSGPAIVRRVWAPTIHQALDAMVADRRTDETLQQIEQAALAEGALWPRPPAPPEDPD
jgi:hypothetical protein